MGLYVENEDGGRFLQKEENEKKCCLSREKNGQLFEGLKVGAVEREGMTGEMLIKHKSTC